MIKIIYMACILLTSAVIGADTAQAADDDGRTASPASARLSGTLLFRQYSNETNSSVFHQFIALIPEHLLPDAFFEKTAPAAYYNLIDRGIVLNPETQHAQVVPPFSRFEFSSVVPGNYWLCKFNNADEIIADGPEKTEEFMLSGCQFTEIRDKKDTERNYYADEYGLWMDDFKPDEEKKSVPVRTEIPEKGDSTCTSAP